MPPVRFRETAERQHPLRPFALRLVGVAAVVPFLHPHEPMIEIDTTLTYTPEQFGGYVATVEWIRRMAGSHHPAFLEALREELERNHPDGLVERNREYLLLARRP